MHLERARAGVGSAGVSPAFGTAAILAAFLFISTTLFAAPPNVILITIDTLRADYIGSNGSKKVKTPNLDALAARGANFRRVRSSVPLTLPSHASILTGLYPPAHGVRDNAKFRLGQSAVTLTEVLKKNGYRTAAFVGSFVLDSRFGLDQGFDFYEDRTWSDASMLEHFEAERSAETVHQEVVRWLRSNRGTKPLFLWIHFYDPHAPYAPPAPFLSRYPQDPYAAEVAYTDSVIGQLYRDLSALNLLNDTVIAMVGDHGEGLGEHQETTHSVLIYNSTLHVPMFIIAPGKIAPGKQITQLCRTIDLAPTLLDYLGIQKIFGEGVSLRNLIEGKPQQDLTAYSESLYPKLNLGWSALTGLESANHHYIESPEPELFEVQKDPFEKLNRIKQFPKVALRHRENLQKFASNGARVSLPAEPMDPETREKLASLGYVSGSSTATGNGSGVDPKRKIGIWNQIQIALYHMSRKEYPVAIEKLKPILLTEKQMPVLYDYLGSAYMQMKDWSNAEKIYKQAFQLGIESSMFHMNLGLVHQNRKEYAKAEQELQKAIDMDSYNVSAHYHLGNVLRTRGQLQKALQHYEAALKLNPHYVFALNGAGMIYATLKQDEPALRSFQEAVKLDPANAPAYFNLAVQLERMNRTKAALDTYKKFLSVSNEKEFAAQRQKAAEAIRRLGTTQEHR